MDIHKQKHKIIQNLLKNNGVYPMIESEEMRTNIALVGGTENEDRGI